jgi:hypothetical protein
MPHYYKYRNKYQIFIFIRIKSLVCMLIVTALTTADFSLDTFGIRKLFPTKAGTREWNSAHWNNGIARTVKYAPDPYDPTGWTDDHSSGSDGFRVNGSGMLRMSGGGPRFHINSLITSKVAAQKFRDVEFTAYYRRHGANGANWGGMVVGLRSGPLGHASPGGSDCDATTYYGRFRNDGKWDFEKELKHPGSTYWSGSGYNTQDPLWRGAPMPQNRWIGMKYIAVNMLNNTQVKLTLYIDSSSNSDPRNGGHWEKVGEVIDAGVWPSGDVAGCSYTNAMVITEGGGTALLRTDNDTADYKMVSIREIDPGQVDVAALSGSTTRAGMDNKLVLMGTTIIAAEYTIFDLRGRIVLRGTIPAGGSTRLSQPSAGVLFLQVHSKKRNTVFKILAE